MTTCGTWHAVSAFLRRRAPHSSIVMVVPPTSLQKSRGGVSGTASFAAACEKMASREASSKQPLTRARAPGPSALPPIPSMRMTASVAVVGHRSACVDDADHPRCALPELHCDRLLARGIGPLAHEPVVSSAQPKRAGDLPVSPLREAESARGVKGPVETDRTPDGHVRARHRGALAIEVHRDRGPRPQLRGSPSARATDTACVRRSRARSPRREASRAARFIVNVTPSFDKRNPCAARAGQRW